ncbi:MAG: isopenicillin-N N-acyltransferase-like protein [Myxococcota bacterium]|jgi:isopenicillin-N N-acyltransferase-like protein
MGRAFGETCRDAIHAFADLRVANAIRQTLHYGKRDVDRSQVIEAGLRCQAPTERFDPVGFAELRGIAEGANLALAEVIAMNGLTDIRDILSWPGGPEDAEGCSAFVAQGDITAAGTVICGQTWDLATDNLPYVIGVHRQPTEGPETWCLTTVGCLSLIGMNSHGLAIGTTNIRTRDARPGVTYLSLIHRALREEKAADAARIITDAQRAGAHFYFVADAQGDAHALECSATTVAATQVNTGAYGHTNHCLVTENVAQEAVAPSPSSLARQARLHSLFETHAGAIDATTAKSFFANEEDGPNSVCRDDLDGINTNGAVIMLPATGQILACHGVPTRATWLDLKTGDTA